MPATWPFSIDPTWTSPRHCGSRRARSNLRAQSHRSPTRGSTSARLAVIGRGEETATSTSPASRLTFVTCPRAHCPSTWPSHPRTTTRPNAQTETSRQDPRVLPTNAALTHAHAGRCPNTETTGLLLSSTQPTHWSTKSGPSAHPHTWRQHVCIRHRTDSQEAPKERLENAVVTAWAVAQWLESVPARSDRFDSKWGQARVGSSRVTRNPRGSDRFGSVGCSFGSEGSGRRGRRGRIVKDLPLPVSKKARLPAAPKGTMKQHALDSTLGIPLHPLSGAYASIPLPPRASLTSMDKREALPPSPFGGPGQCPSPPHLGSESLMSHLG